MGRLHKRLDAWQREWPAFTPEVQEYLLSDEGIEHVMCCLSDAFENWRWCPVKSCRRARCCLGPDMMCQLKERRHDASPEEIARANARMRQLAEQRLERLGIVPW